MTCHSCSVVPISQTDDEYASHYGTSLPGSSGILLRKEEERVSQGSQCRMRVRKGIVMNRCPKAEVEHQGSCILLLFQRKNKFDKRKTATKREREREKPLKIESDGDREHRRSPKKHFPWQPFLFPFDLSRISFFFF